MKTYTVRSSAKISQLNSSWSKASRPAKIEIYKAAQKALRGIVEKFAFEHLGEVILSKQDFWMGVSLDIQTTPELAEQLGKVKGISSVLELVPSKVTPEKKTGPQGPSAS
jgi:hypothetical protein